MTDTDSGKRLSDVELVFALRTIGDRPIETAEGICAQAADALARLTQAPEMGDKELRDIAREALRRGAPKGCAIPKCKCFADGGRNARDCAGICEDAVDHVVAAMSRVRASLPQPAAQSVLVEALKEIAEDDAGDGDYGFKDVGMAFDRLQRIAKKALSAALTTTSGGNVEERASELLTDEQITELTRQHAEACHESFLLKGEYGPKQKDFHFRSLEYVGRLLSDRKALSQSPPHTCREGMVEALRLAKSHIEHMAKWIAAQKSGYSFESLGEDMPTINAALAPSKPAPVCELTDAQVELARWAILWPVNMTIAEQRQNIRAAFKAAFAASPNRPQATEEG